MNLDPTGFSESIFKWVMSTLNSFVTFQCSKKCPLKIKFQVFNVLASLVLLVGSVLTFLYSPCGVVDGGTNVWELYTVTFSSW